MSETPPPLPAIVKTGPFSDAPLGTIGLAYLHVWCQLRSVSEDIGTSLGSQL